MFLILKKINDFLCQCDFIFWSFSSWVHVFVQFPLNILCCKVKVRHNGVTKRKIKLCATILHALTWLPIQTKEAGRRKSKSHWGPDLLKFARNRFTWGFFYCDFTKSKVIWEGNFGVFKSPKKQQKFLKEFCPSLHQVKNCYYKVH